MCLVAEIETPSSLGAEEQESFARERDGRERRLRYQTW